MDKAELVAKAPDYYIAAIGYVMVNASSPYTLEKISGELEIDLRTDLFEVAIRHMQKLGAVTVEHDDFGPTLYRRTESTYNWWSNKAPNEIAVIARLQSLASNDRQEWLQRGLKSLNQQAWTAGLSASDFASPPPDEWQPIPIDRVDPTFQGLEAAVEKAISEIEGSNGYAATAPEERNYVVSQLGTFRRHIKTEAQIQWMQVQTFALEPLGMAIERFGNAASGLVAQAAKQYMPRFTQLAVWRYCAASGLAICNGMTIDDRARCDNQGCPLFHVCDRVTLYEAKAAG